jgi:hypothetical protein
VRAESTRKDTGVSRLLASILKERMMDEEQYERAKRQALAREPFLNQDR